MKLYLQLIGLLTDLSEIWYKMSAAKVKLSGGINEIMSLVNRFIDRFG